MKGTSEGNRNEAVAFCFKALARRNEDKQSTTRTPTTVLPNFIRMNSEFQKAITEISSSSVGNVEFRTTCNLRQLPKIVSIKELGLKTKHARKILVQNSCIRYQICPAIPKSFLAGSQMSTQPCKQTPLFTSLVLSFVSLFLSLFVYEFSPKYVIKNQYVSLEALLLKKVQVTGRQFAVYCGALYPSDSHAMQPDHPAGSSFLKFIITVDILYMCMMGLHASVSSDRIIGTSIIGGSTHMNIKIHP